MCVKCVCSRQLTHFSRIIPLVSKWMSPGVTCFSISLYSLCGVGLSVQSFWVQFLPEGIISSFFPTRFSPNLWITPDQLAPLSFNLSSPIISKVQEMSNILISPPLFNGKLNDKQWAALEKVNKDLQEEYEIRRKTLMKRLDVTIQSFQVICGFFNE